MPGNGPIIGIPNLVQFIVKGQWNTGHNTANSFHFSSSTGGPYSVGDLTVLASQVATSWGTTVANHQSNEWSLVEVEAIDRSVTDGNKALWVGSAAGGGGAAPMPLNTSVLMQWSDTAHYRGGHARTYVPGPTEDQTTDGHQLTSAAHTAWATDWTNFLTDVLGGGPYGSIRPLAWAAAHYKRRGEFLVSPNFSTIEPLGPSTVLATQRRRLRKAAHS